MMFGRGRFFKVLFGGFLMLALFGAIFGGSSRSRYAEGYYEGFAAGQQQAQAAERVGETAVPAPQPVQPPAYGPRHYHFGPLGFIGGLFQFFLTLMLIGFVFKLFAFRRFARHRGWKRHHGWHKHGGPRRWRDSEDHDDGYEKSTEDVEPDIKTV